MRFGKFGFLCVLAAGVLSAQAAAADDNVCAIAAQYVNHLNPPAATVSCDATCTYDYCDEHGRSDPNNLQGRILTDADLRAGGLTAATCKYKDLNGQLKSALQTAQSTAKWHNETFPWEPAQPIPAALTADEVAAASQNTCICRSSSGRNLPSSNPTADIMNFSTHTQLRGNSSSNIAAWDSLCGNSPSSFTPVSAATIKTPAPTGSAVPVGGGAPPPATPTAVANGPVMATELPCGKVCSYSGTIKAKLSVTINGSVASVDKIYTVPIACTVAKGADCPGIEACQRGGTVGVSGDTDPATGAPAAGGAR